MAGKGGYPPGWLITADGAVIGDIGTHGPVDEAGRVEIGYGLAAPSRGQGYGSEAVGAVTQWPLSQPGGRPGRAHTLTPQAPRPPVPGKARFASVRPHPMQALYPKTFKPA